MPLEVGIFLFTLILTTLVFAIAWGVGEASLANAVLWGICALVFVPFALLLPGPSIATDYNTTYLAIILGMLLPALVTVWLLRRSRKRQTPLQNRDAAEAREERSSV